MQPLLALMEADGVQPVSRKRSMCHESCYVTVGRCSSPSCPCAERPHGGWVTSCHKYQGCTCQLPTYESTYVHW